MPEDWCKQEALKGHSIYVTIQGTKGDKFGFDSFEGGKWEGLVAKFSLTGAQETQVKIHFVKNRRPARLPPKYLTPRKPSDGFQERKWLVLSGLFAGKVVTVGQLTEKDGIPVAEIFPANLPAEDLCRDDRSHGSFVPIKFLAELT